MRLWKVLITGSRDWTNRQAIADVIMGEFENAQRQGRQLMVIHGSHHSGADAIAEKVCEEKGYASARCPARWNVLGPSAGPIRNAWMVSLSPDVAYGFPLGVSGPNQSRGIMDCVDRCRAAGIPVFCYPFDKKVAT